MAVAPRVLLPFALPFQLSYPLPLGYEYPQRDLNCCLFGDNGHWGKNALGLKPGYGMSYLFTQQKV